MGTWEEKAGRQRKSRTEETTYLRLQSASEEVGGERKRNRRGWVKSPYWCQNHSFSCESDTESEGERGGRYSHQRKCAENRQYLTSTALSGVFLGGVSQCAASGKSNLNQKTADDPVRSGYSRHSRNAEVPYYRAAIRAFRHQHSGGLHQCCGIKSWLLDGSIGSFRFNEVLCLCLCQVDFKPGLTEVHCYTLIMPGIPDQDRRTDPGWELFPGQAQSSERLQLIRPRSEALVGYRQRVGFQPKQLKDAVLFPWQQICSSLGTSARCSEIVFYLDMNHLQWLTLLSSIYGIN